MRLSATYLNVPQGAGKDNVFDFNMADFVSKYRLPVIETFNSLSFLQREGYIEFTEEINNPSRVHFVVGRDDLYKFQVANESFDGFIKLLSEIIYRHVLGICGYKRRNTCKEICTDAG